MSSHELNDKKVEFDEDCERISTKYEILNVNHNNLVTVGEFTVKTNDSVFLFNHVYSKEYYFKVGFERYIALS